MDADPIGGSHASAVAQLAGVPSDNTTVSDVLTMLDADGFRGSFGARSGGRLRCSACRSDLDPADLDVAGFRRLEGASDPSDEVIIVAATCPICRARGTAVLGFGPAASLDDALAARSLRIDGR